MQQSEAQAQAPSYDELLEFYKALVHPARLRIAGRLVAGPCALPELARDAGESPAAVVRYLAVLAAAGIVRDLGRGRYELDVERLRQRAAEVLDSPRTRQLGGAKDERSRVLASFFRDGRLTAWPSGDQRKLVILEEIASHFEPERTYAEREVNQVLARFHDDYTMLRRALVDYHLMNRHQGVYWLGAGRAGSHAGAAAEEEQRT